MSAKSALVVDDSKSARFALRRYLENHNFKVDAVESAEEAYNFLQQNRPEVIFLDHVMPGTDGFEALRHIKSDPRTVTIPVVICSSNEGDQFTQEARSKGAADVLQKPPSPEQLSRILLSLQRLSVTLRPSEARGSAGSFNPNASGSFTAAPGAASPVAMAPAAAAAIPPAAPSKVSNIREPEVAIEQAVMKALRSAIPPLVEPTLPPPTPATPVSASGMNPASSGNLGALGEQMEARMKKVTQDLFMQLAELKGTMAHLESRVGNNPRLPEEDHAAMHEIANSAMSGIKQRIEALERNIQVQLTSLRAQIDASLAAHSERINQITQAARAAAAEEAQAVSERTVMSAASRISDQLADSIRKALGRG